MAIAMASLFFLLPSLVLSQQSYEANLQFNCYATNASTTLGYTCNSIPSCSTYLTFRSQPPHLQTPSQISSFLNSSSPSALSSINLLPSTSSPSSSGDLLLIPTSCSCNSNSSFYQHDAAFTITSASNTYLRIANDTYQGLSTCQSLIAQNPQYDSRNLTLGQTVRVPLRCACPTANQTRAGIKYLLTYAVTWGDDPTAVAQMFGVDSQSILDANGLAQGQTIYPFTTLLVPLKTQPRKPQLASSPPPPPPSPPQGSPDESGGSGKKWVFVGVGIGAGFLVLCLVLGLYYYCWFQRRARPVLEGMPGAAVGKKVEDSSSAEYGAVWGKEVPDSLVSSEVRTFIESLVVYKFGELERATGFFGEGYRIKGSVYRAVINGDEAAVKRLKGDVTNEINILKQINHSNVVRLSGFCVHEGDTYLVYEFVEKGSLSDWLHHKKDLSDCVLSWKQRVRIAYDVAEGLNYLHNYTNPMYIHKDLKSSNILLDSEFRAKLANFGLARILDEGQEGPQLTRHVVGTQGYMAPEYLEHGLITPKLDVFAFGVVMLELLSGKEATFPKDGEEKGELLLWQSIEKVMSGEDVRSKLKGVIDPSMRNDYPFDLAFAMAELAMQCVVKDPGSRPEVTEVLMSLSAIYNSTLDWDPSSVGNSGSRVQAR